MEDFISALKSNDLVKAKKAVGAMMLERTADLISQRRVEIAQSIMIEGEEKEDDKDEDTDSEDKDDKEKSDSKDEKDSEDEDD
ncbi:prohead core protein [Erwinia phage COW86c]